MTIQISQLESKQRELIQKMALEQKEIEEKETVLEEREAALETCRKVNKKEEKMKKKLSVWLLWPFTVFLLGVWHLLDVQASVTETGHCWLYGWYGGLFFVSRQC